MASSQTSSCGKRRLCLSRKANSKVKNVFCVVASSSQSTSPSDFLSISGEKENKSSSSSDFLSNSREKENKSSSPLDFLSNSREKENESTLPSSFLSSSREKENEEAISPNGSLRECKKVCKPKEVKKRGGQRKAVRPSKAQTHKEIEVIVIDDDESSASDDETSRPPPPKNADGTSRPPPHKKARKFTRCSKSEKHLCEVCSRDDCRKCSNCLNKSTRHQACKMKPRNKCRRWKKNEGDTMEARNECRTGQEEMQLPTTNLDLESLARVTQIPASASTSVPQLQDSLDSVPSPGFSELLSDTHVRPNDPTIQATASVGFSDLDNNSTGATIQQSTESTADPTIRATASVGFSDLDNNLTGATTIQQSTESTASEKPISSLGTRELEKNVVCANLDCGESTLCCDTNSPQTNATYSASDRQVICDSASNNSATDKEHAEDESELEDADSEAEIENTFQRGMEETVKLHITKCGVSGPPNTGKSHVRALMLGLPPPKERISTAIATDADVIDAEDVVDMKKTDWKVIKDDTMYMVRKIANTLHKQKYIPPTSHPNPRAHPKSSIRQRYKLIKKIKERLKEMRRQEQGKKSRKRQCLNGIHLVYFVDTGGQSQFQEILPNFIKCDVNLLVHNMSQNLEDCPKFNYVVKGKEYSVPEQLGLSNISIIEQSVRSITSSIASAERRPHVAIIGTFKDKCDPGSSSYKRMLKEKSQQIDQRLEPYAGTGVGKCNIFSFHRDERIFPIDGSKDGWKQNDKTLEALKRCISDCSERREVDLPIKYLIFYQNLLQYAQTEKNRNCEYVSLADCYEVASTSDICMSESDVHEALQLFSDCNLLLYFPEILKDLVFIKPGFLFGKVTDLIVASFDCESDSIPDCRAEFQRTGVFGSQILADIKFPKGIFTQSHFLELLKGLFVIAEVKPASYFMPCVLPPVESSNEKLGRYERLMTENGFNGPFVISFANGMSPRGLFCSLLVALAGNPNATWKLINLNSGVFRRRNLVEFEYYTTFDQHVGSVVIVDRNSRLEIYSTCARQHCITIREEIYEAFTCACNSLDYNYSELYFFGFICRACVHKQQHSSEVFRDDLNSPWKEKCQFRKRGLQLPKDRAIWFEDDNSEFFQELCNEVATETEKWEDIATELGISQDDISCIEERGCGDTQKCFRAVFDMWRKQGKLPFTWDAMINVLRANSVEEIVLADRLQNIHCH